MNIINFIKNKFYDLIDYVNKLGLFKEFIIFTLIFSIIFISMWDKILSIFIEIRGSFLNNTITIIPLLILSFIITLSICSHFKIFGINANFAFDSKIVSFNKYKTLINAKIEKYKKKKLNLYKLYNEKYLIRNKLKYNIAYLTKNINFLTNLNEKLLIDCIEVNAKSNQFKNKFYNKIKNNIDDVAFKANLVFDSAIAIKNQKYAEARKRRALDNENQIQANKWNAQREEDIIKEKARRQRVITNERLMRIDKARKLKYDWLPKAEKQLRDGANSQFVNFYDWGNFTRHCGRQPPHTTYLDWGKNRDGYNRGRNRYGVYGYVNHCGHDRVSSLLVSSYLVLVIWQHTHKRGRAYTLYEGRYNSGDLIAIGLHDEISCSEVTINVPKLNNAVQKLKNRPLTKFGIDLYVEGSMGKLTEAEARLIFPNPADYNIQLKNRKFQL
jgi:hypothetical protein